MFNFFENPKIDKKPDLSKDIQWVPTKSKNKPEYLNVTVAVRKESPLRDLIGEELVKSNFSLNQEREGNINLTYYGFISENEFNSLRSKIESADFEKSDNEDFRQAA